MNINEAVAVNVRRERRIKGYSLDKAAKLTGVSKSMLGQIERGEVNPTVSVLHKIATGLEVSCSSLLEIPEPEVELVSSSNAPCRKENGGKVTYYAIVPMGGKERFGIYRVRILTSGRCQVAAHQAGTNAYITVYYGTLLLTVDGTEYRLMRGDAIRFRADQPYQLYNRDVQMCEFQLMVTSARDAQPGPAQDLQLT